MYEVVTYRGSIRVASYSALERNEIERYLAQSLTAARYPITGFILQWEGVEIERCGYFQGA